MGRRTHIKAVLTVYPYQQSKLVFADAIRLSYCAFAQAKPVQKALHPLTLVPVFRTTLYKGFCCVRLAW